MGALAGVLYGLFAIGFTERALRRVSFEINPSNKDPQKGLSWYRERLELQMHHMLYRCEKSSDGVVFHPLRLYRIFETPVHFTYDPYSINITASRMTMRILLDNVGIEATTPKSN